MGWPPQAANMQAIEMIVRAVLEHGAADMEVTAEYPDYVTAEHAGAIEHYIGNMRKTLALEALKAGCVPLALAAETRAPSGNGMWGMTRITLTVPVRPAAAA